MLSLTFMFSQGFHEKVFSYFGKSYRMCACITIPIKTSYLKEVRSDHCYITIRTINNLSKIKKSCATVLSL